MEVKSSFLGNFSKFKNSYIESRIKGKYIDYKIDNVELFRYAKENKLLCRYNNNIYFCNFRTKFNDKDCVLSFFVIRTEKKNSENEIGFFSIEMLNMMETNFYPILYKEYKKSKTSDDKLVSFLKVITEII